MAVTGVSTMIGIFLNRALPAIDVSFLSILRDWVLSDFKILSACWTLVGVIGAPHRTHTTVSRYCTNHRTAILICLSVKAAAGRRTASYALGHFDPSPSGWTPGWAFCIGLLPVRVIVSCNSILL